MDNKPKNVQDEQKIEISQSESNVQELQMQNTEKQQKDILESGQVTSNQNELLKKLEQKWGINLAEIEREQNKQLEQKKKLQKEYIENLKAQYELSIMMEERKNVKISKFAQLQQQIEAKEQKSLKLESRGEINKNNEYPLQYAYFMEERPDMTPKYNVGEKWGQIVEQQAMKTMQVRSDVSSSFFWAMTKKGRLGVDLFAISFGILGIAILPVYFYFKKQKRTSIYQKEFQMIHKIEDLENSELDLDDISIQKTNYNLYQKEINDEKSKQISLHEEINKLIQLIYK